MKILFIATSSKLGDCVVATSGLNYFVEKFPNAHFFIACGTPLLLLFEGLERTKTLIPLDREKRSLHWFKFWPKICTKYWDVIIDTRGSVISCFLLKSKTYNISPKSHIQETSVDQIKKVINADLKTTVWPDKKWKKRADEIFNSSDKSFVIAISPFASWDKKEWGIENFKKLCDIAKKAIKNVRFVIFSDHPEENCSFSNISHIDVIDSENLGVISHCIKKCDLLISADSGLFHLAAALRIKTICLVGPTPKHFINYDKSTHFIEGKGRMDNISPEMVLDAITEIIKAS